MPFQVLSVTPEAHEDSAWSVAWRGSTLATGCVDGTVKTWTWKDGAAPDGAHDAGSVARLEAHGGALTGHALGVVSVALVIGGEGEGEGRPALCVASSLASEIIAWELESRSTAHVIDPGVSEAFTLAAAPDGDRVATGTYTGGVHLVNVRTGKIDASVPDLDKGRLIASVAYSPDGRLLACGSVGGAVTLYDLEAGKTRHRLAAHAMPVRSVAFSPDSRLLLTASDDGQLKLYDAHHGGSVATFTGHAGWVLCAAFAPSGTTFASSGSDHTVKVWDWQKRQCAHTFAVHTDQVWSLAYNDRGDRLASAGDDRQLCIYDAQ